MEVKKGTEKAKADSSEMDSIFSREMVRRIGVCLPATIVAFLFSISYGLSVSWGSEILGPMPSERARQVSGIQSMKARRPMKINARNVVKRVRTLIKRGKNFEALEILESACTEPARCPSLYSDYLVLLCWTGQQRRATSLFEKLPASFPMRPYLLRNVAKAYFDEGAYVRSASLYEKALDRDPTDLEAVKGLFLALFKTGKYGLALRHIRSVEYGKAGCPEELLKLRDDAIASLPRTKQVELLAQLRALFNNGDLDAAKDLVLSEILFHKYRKALSMVQRKQMGSMSAHLLSWVAWSYFKTGEINRALQIYDRVLEKFPSYRMARIGRAYCMAASGRAQEALRDLDALLNQRPDDTETLFAKAYVYEQIGLFWEAVSQYDKILTHSPQNQVARKLRLLDLSDLGVSSHSLDETIKLFPSNVQLYDRFLVDMAAERIRWKEPEWARGVLHNLLEKGREGKRAGFDYIASLGELKCMGEVLKEYDKLASEGVAVPPYVLNVVAAAYLRLELPEEALQFYEESLTMNPHSFEARMGKFYALQDLRRWKEAWSTIRGIEADTPRFVTRGRKSFPYWPAMEVAIAKGWLLAYEDRLKEAEACFQGLHKKAPSNTTIRTGLAHVYLWRGWPRRALEEFKIIRTMDPTNIDALNGLSVTLDSLAKKKEGKDLNERLLLLDPRNKHVLETARSFDVEQMKVVATRASVTRESDDSGELWLEMEGSQPVSLYTRIHLNTLWSSGESKNQSKNLWRMGLGVEHIFNSTVQAYQQLSWDRTTGNHLGSLTKLNITPNDHVALNLSYDSCSPFTALRARAAGIRSRVGRAELTYRDSELRNEHLSYTWSSFSDGNTRQEWDMGLEQGLFSKNDWAVRVFADLYRMDNSEVDTPYYNPEEAWGTSATLMVQQTVMRMYNRAIVHRIFCGLGWYKERDYSGGLTARIRYEQEQDFSDTNSLFWAVEVTRNMYDGDGVEGFTCEAGWRLRF